MKSYDCNRSCDCNKFKTKKMKRFKKINYYRRNLGNKIKLKNILII